MASKSSILILLLKLTQHSNTKNLQLKAGFSDEQNLNPRNLIFHVPGMKKIKISKANLICGGGWLLWSNWNQMHVDETLKLVMDLVQITCTLAMEYMEA
ncbi:uncharacterized protein LOC112007245 isoform X2 [Quercus suber]|uniref:uncharacterized protein LOC112007245 isoform X2 n=1 Tax=Quercus suber TaxID=58331 RepID=UPI0032DF39C5